MKRVKLYNKDGDMLVCWEDTARRLITKGWSDIEPSKKRQAKTIKSAIAIETDIETKEV